MDKLKTHKCLFWLALALMVVLGIFMIYEYISKTPLDPWGWVGMAAMAFTAVSQFMIIREIKNKQ